MLFSLPTILYHQKPAYHSLTFHALFQRHYVPSTTMAILNYVADPALPDPVKEGIDELYDYADKKDKCAEWANCFSKDAKLIKGDYQPTGIPGKLETTLLVARFISNEHNPFKLWLITWKEAGRTPSLAYTM